MNVFKRKSIYAAVLASVGAVGFAGTANAVHVNPDGLGQLLVYPYYTVRTAAAGGASGEYNTYVSVTNTTANYKAVKVRFLEGKASAEVLDFNLYLSPYDVWTGSVEPTTSGAMLVSSDKSCTFGVIPTSGQPFSNAAYVGDGEDETLDRTREGYIEIIEMGEIPANWPVVDTNGVGSLRTAVKHVSGVAPCTGSVLSAADAASLSGLTAPTGGLLGTGTLVNPATGAEYAYDAVALDNWSTVPVGAASSSSAPTVGSGDVVDTEVFQGGSVVVQTFAANVDATSAAIMHNNVINEFVLDTITASATDWVVTFPTKAQYVGVDTCNGGNPCSNILTVRDHNAALAPFNENFGLGGACDAVGLTVRSREEQTPSSGGGFSPGISTTPKLCWESNVISFNRSTVSPLTSGILGSTNVRNIDTSYQNGWVNLAFKQAVGGGNLNTQALVAASSTTNGVADATAKNALGLPVVGFMVQDFVNGNLGGVQSTYGGDFIHKGTRCLSSTATHALAVAASHCL